MVSKVSRKASKKKKHQVHPTIHRTVKKRQKKQSVPSSKSSKSGVNNKLDKILTMENKLLHEEQSVEREEKKIENEETQVEKMADTLKKEETDIEKLEKIEEEIKSEVGVHPLAQINLKDITKGLIGAFIGLAIHYTFVYGVEISQNLTMIRATIMFPVTFLVGVLFIYATGFRKVQDTRLLVYMPVRVFILYLCALVMSVLVLYLFYPDFGSSFQTSYKMVAGVMLAAIVGACTADLIGKE